MVTSALGVGPVDYTYDWFRELVTALSEADYRFRGFDAAPGSGDVFLRHDVDWSPAAALEMAEIEAELGVRATYFVLLTSPFYNALSEHNRRTVVRIEELGHDVELHFPVREFWAEDPGAETVAEGIQEHAEMLGTVVDDRVSTVAFHNPPEWTFGRTYPGFTSTYEPTFFEDIAYESDSLHRWREDPPFVGALPEAVQVLIHPTLWGPDDCPPEEHIRAAQRRRRDRMDERMREYSRLDWD